MVTWPPNPLPLEQNESIRWWSLHNKTAHADAVADWFNLMAPLHHASTVYMQVASLSGQCICICALLFREGKERFSDNDLLSTSDATRITITIIIHHTKLAPQLNCACAHPGVSLTLTLSLTVLLWFHWEAAFFFHPSCCYDAWRNAFQVHLRSCTSLVCGRRRPLKSEPSIRQQTQVCCLIEQHNAMQADEPTVVLCTWLHEDSESLANSSNRQDEE